MNWKPIIQILAALFGFGFVQAVVYVFLVVIAFDFWPCGNSYLDDREVDSIQFFTLVGLALLQALIGIRLVIRKEYILAGYVALVLNLVTFFFIFMTGGRCLNWNNYYKEFSKKEWANVSKRSLKMARYIINYKFLEGKTRDEVMQLLGPGEQHYSVKGNQLFYYTEDVYSPLVVEFKNEKVSRYFLSCLD